MPAAEEVLQRRTGSILPQLAGCVGNVLEWYDFAAYGFLAASFAGNFFPLDNHLLSLVNFAQQYDALPAAEANLVVTG